MSSKMIEIPDEVVVDLLFSTEKSRKREERRKAERMHKAVRRKPNHSRLRNFDDDFALDLY